MIIKRIICCSPHGEHEFKGTDAKTQAEIIVAPRMGSMNLREPLMIT